MIKKEMHPIKYLLFYHLISSHLISSNIILSSLPFILFCNLQFQKTYIKFLHSQIYYITQIPQHQQQLLYQMIAEEECLKEQQFQRTNFKIIKNIGKGCQGQVYQIENIITKQHYALKSIYISPSISQKQKKRIQCQIQSNIDISCHISSSLNFPKMYTYWVDKNSISIVFQLCHQNAQQGFKKLKKYSEKYNYLFVLLFDILTSLSLLQKLNIIHRDIKSQNILLKNAIFKLSDLGLSRIYQIQSNTTNPNTIKFTNDIGNRLGRSPQFITGKYSYKTDIWSLGIHIYYMLQNTLPFDEQSLLKIKTNPNEIQKIISSQQLQINFQSTTKSKKSKNILSYIYLILSQMIVKQESNRSTSKYLLDNYFNRNNITIQHCNIQKIALFGYLYQRRTSNLAQYYLIILLSHIDFYKLNGKIKIDDYNKKKINSKVQLTLLQILRFTYLKYLKQQQQQQQRQQLQKIIQIYDFIKKQWQNILLHQYEYGQVYYDIQCLDQAMEIFKINRIKQKFILLQWIMKLVKSIEYIKRGMICYRIPIWQIPLEISKIL